MAHIALPAFFISPTLAKNLKRCESSLTRISCYIVLYIFLRSFQSSPLVNLQRGTMPGPCITRLRFYLIKTRPKPQPNLKQTSSKPQPFLEHVLMWPNLAVIKLSVKYRGALFVYQRNSLKIHTFKMLQPLLDTLKKEMSAAHIILT